MMTSAKRLAGSTNWLCIGRTVLRYCAMTLSAPGGGEVGARRRVSHGLCLTWVLLVCSEPQGWHTGRAATLLDVAP